MAIFLPNLLAPLAYGFVTYCDSSCCQQFFDISEAESESEIQPDRMAYYWRRIAIIEVNLTVPTQLLTDLPLPKCYLKSSSWILCPQVLCLPSSYELLVTLIFTLHPGQRTQSAELGVAHTAAASSLGRFCGICRIS